ncbi:MAG: hypothetical protein IIB26_00415 [Chloroflexi bacterium]|nr:hypothetical protein [Chloroflexota bacterium]
MPVIRIDKDVYAWLQGNARAFEDTPNSVLRRMARLPDSEPTAATHKRENQTLSSKRRSGVQGPRPIRGAQLAIEEGLSVRRAYYHHEGTWYQVPLEFPAALFDLQGFVIFETENAYRNTPGVDVGEKTNVRSGIASLPGYQLRN